MKYTLHVHRWGRWEARAFGFGMVYRVCEKCKGQSVSAIWLLTEKQLLKGHPE